MVANFSHDQAQNDLSIIWITSCTTVNKLISVQPRLDNLCFVHIPLLWSPQIFSTKTGFVKWMIRQGTQLFCWFCSVLVHFSSVIPILKGFSEAIIDFFCCLFNSLPA